jgi:acyl-CoA thioesterase-1
MPSGVSIVLPTPFNEIQRFSSVICLFLFLLNQTSVYANNSAIDILILGDSLSAAHNIPVNDSWPQLFSHNIRSSFPQSSVINASISGETTYGGLQRLPDLLAEHKPSHLIIELGGNDGLRGLNFGQTTDNLGQMVELAQRQQVSVLLIGVRMPPNLGIAYNDRFQKIYENVASQYSIHYLPRFLEGIAASDADLMQADGIHPTRLAQPLLAQKVWLQMQQIIDH